MKEMPHDTKLILDLAPRLTCLLPLANDELVLFLPVLPDNIQFNDRNYKIFLDKFGRVRCDLSTGEFFGTIVVEHEYSDFRVKVLPQFILALQKKKQVRLVPYDPYVGIPEQDVFCKLAPTIDPDTDVGVAEGSTPFGEDDQM